MLPKAKYNFWIAFIDPAIDCALCTASKMSSMWLSDSQSKFQFSASSQFPRTVLRKGGRWLFTWKSEVGVAFCSGGRYDHDGGPRHLRSLWHWSLRGVFPDRRRNYVFRQSHVSFVIQLCCEQAFWSFCPRLAMGNVRCKCLGNHFRFLTLECTRFSSSLALPSSSVSKKPRSFSLEGRN